MYRKSQQGPGVERSPGVPGFAFSTLQRKKAAPQLSQQVPVIPAKHSGSRWVWGVVGGDGGSSRCFRKNGAVFVTGEMHCLLAGSEALYTVHLGFRHMC